MVKPAKTQTTVFAWGIFYLICSFIGFLLLFLFGVDKMQKAPSDGIALCAGAVGVFLQGLMMFSIAKSLDATNRMCSYLVDIAEAAEKERASTAYKEPWSCPICKQQNSYWDEKCVKCGHAR
jgi:hypothetical protein